MREIRFESIRFRPFALADVELLAEWLAEADLGVPAGVDDQAWGRRMLTDPGIVCGAATRAEDGATQGFFRLDLAPDNTAEVTLIVSPALRRCGLGGILLEEALAEARRRGLRELFAVVNDWNRAGQGFFLSAGFEPSGTQLRDFVHLRRIVHGSDREHPLEITV